MGHWLCKRGFSAPFCLVRVTVVREFLDVVHEAVEFPLRIHLLLPAQREAVELLVVPDVAEDRFDRGKALAVALAPVFTVNALFHPVGMTFLASVGTPPVEGDLTDLGLVGRTQAFLALSAGHAADSDSR